MDWKTNFVFSIKTNYIFKHVVVCHETNNCITLKNANTTITIELVNDGSIASLQSKNLLVLREHFWINRQQQMIGRLQSCLQLNTRIGARKTIVMQIESNLGRAFLVENHLLGKTKSKYYFGLFLTNQLVAVASFSKPMLMKFDTPNYYSYQWDRLAFKQGITVIGGASKLFLAFLAAFKPAHVMTHLDGDWPPSFFLKDLGFLMEERYTLPNRITEKWVWKY